MIALNFRRSHQQLSIAICSPLPNAFHNNLRNNSSNPLPMMTRRKALRTLNVPGSTKWTVHGPESKKWTDTDKIISALLFFKHSNNKKYYRIVDIPSAPNWQIFSLMSYRQKFETKKQQSFPHEEAKLFAINENLNKMYCEWQFKKGDFDKKPEVKMLLKDMNLLRFRDSLLQAIFKMNKLKDNYEKFLEGKTDNEEIEIYLKNQILDDKKKGAMRCFNYLLLDSRFIKNKFNEKCSPKDCTFENFIKSIFYIGKGSQERPMNHLGKAAKAEKNSDNRFDYCYKTERIREIWESGEEEEGVIILRCFEWRFEQEAKIREACMLQARLIYNWEEPSRMDGETKQMNIPSCYDLVNLKDEKVNGLKTAEEIGTNLLVRAYAIFRIEQSKPINERNSGSDYSYKDIINNKKEDEAKPKDEANAKMKEEENEEDYSPLRLNILSNYDRRNRIPWIIKNRVDEANVNGEEEENDEDDRQKEAIDKTTDEGEKKNGEDGKPKIQLRISAEEFLKDYLCKKN